MFETITEILRWMIRISIPIGIIILIRMHINHKKLIKRKVK
jgi:hypothetical protein